MRGSKTKDKLIATAADQFLSIGYAKMSAGTILRDSGVGQGSYYHHFSGKRALAEAAVEYLKSQMMDYVDEIFARDKPEIDRLLDYIETERVAQDGCPMGRLSYDASFHEDAIREIACSYFAFLEGRIIALLEASKSKRQIRGDVDVAAHARLVVTTLQGGYVLGRVTGGNTVMSGAVLALADTLTALKR